MVFLLLFPSSNKCSRCQATDQVFGVSEAPDQVFGSWRSVPNGIIFHLPIPCSGATHKSLSSPVSWLSTSRPSWCYTECQCRAWHSGTSSCFRGLLGGVLLVVLFLFRPVEPEVDNKRPDVRTPPWCCHWSSYSFVFVVCV